MRIEKEGKEDIVRINRIEGKVMSEDLKRIEVRGKKFGGS